MLGNIKPTVERLLLKHLNNHTDFDLEREIHVSRESGSEMMHFKSNAN